MDTLLRRLGIELPKATGEFGYGAQRAGAPLARTMPSGELLARLRKEVLEAAAHREVMHSK